MTEERKKWKKVKYRTPRLGDCGKNMDSRKNCSKSQKFFLSLLHTISPTPSHFLTHTLSQTLSFTTRAQTSINEQVCEAFVMGGLFAHKLNASNQPTIALLEVLLSVPLSVCVSLLISVSL